jgi:ferredoxin-NADP reductase
MGETGRVTPELIARQIPDFAERLFYVSGSSEMVRSTVQALHDLGVHQRTIKTDYFSGLAS